MAEQAISRRCSSPLRMTDREDIKRNRKKITQPLLVILQRGSFRLRKEEYSTQNTSEGDTDLIGNFGTSSSMLASDKSLYLNNSLSCLSTSSSCLLGPSMSSESGSCSSWARPIAGLNNSDSCFPVSCILDCDWEENISEEETDELAGHVDKPDIKLEGI